MKLLTLTAATLTLACMGWFAAPAKAQEQPVALCTPLYNATTGVLSCPPVGQTAPGTTVLNGLPVAAITVTSCGTPPSTPVVGRTFILTIDQNGNMCTSSVGGGGVAVTDSANWTAAVSIFTPVGGEYNSSAQNLLSGQQGTLALSVARHALVLEDNSAAILTAAQAGTGSTGAAVPASAIYAAGINGSGNLTGIAVGGAAVTSSQAVNLASQYPVNNVTTTPTAITGNSTGTTGAVVGTLSGAASVTTYICGFNVSATGGTATLGPITVAGLVGSSQVYQLFSSATGVTLTQTFSPCIPASATNTSITITTTADGTATAVDVNSWGYRL